MKNRRGVHAAVAAVAVLVLVGCASMARSTEFSISTSAVTGPPETGFDSGLISVGRLEREFGAAPGESPSRRSFPFTWSGLPGGTQALVVVFDDPDAKPVLAVFGMEGDTFMGLDTFIHWIAADIDPSLGGLPADASVGAAFPQGQNGMGQNGYIGPQPPADIPADVEGERIHVYRLTAYALSEPTGLESGFTLAELLAAVEDTTLAVAQVYVSYSNE